MDTTSPKQDALTSEDRKAFVERGYLILRDPGVDEIVRSIQAALLPLAEKIVARDEILGPRMSEVTGRGFTELFNWCLANEKDRSVSRRFYELFPASAAFMKLAAEPAFLRWSRELGVSDPIPSTPPILRIDRPGDSVHLTRAHQDYWFSFLSSNAITFWLPILPVTTEMGLLQAIPCSHAAGAVPFRQTGKQNPFEPILEYADSEFVDLEVGPGQILVFNQLLMHRSGINRSDRSRLTLQVRYNDVDTLVEMTSSFTPSYSIFVKAAQDKVLGNGTR